MKKIVYIIGSLGKGGTEKQLVGLANGIADKGYNVIIISYTRGELSKCLSKKVKHIVLREMSISKRYIRYIRNALDMYKILRSIKPDIVQTQLPHTIVTGTIVACIAGVRTRIVSERGMGITRPLWEKYIRRSVYTLNTLIITNTNQIKRRLQKQDKVNPTKVAVIPNAVYIKNEINGIRQRELYELDRKHMVIGSVGRFSHVKGQRYLIEAISRIENKNVRLLLVGDGPDLAEMKKYVNTLGIGKQVLFAGYTAKPALYMACMDIYVSPSLSEGLSNSIMEAMGMGLPVIATKVGGTSELIENGIDGILVEPRNVKQLQEAIQSLGESKNSRCKLGLQAKRKMEEGYSWERLISSYEAVYESY